jgi:hypothetical protein
MCFGVFFSRCGVILAGSGAPGTPRGPSCSRCMLSSEKFGSTPFGSRAFPIHHLLPVKQERYLLFLIGRYRFGIGTNPGHGCFLFQRPGLARRGTGCWPRGTESGLVEVCQERVDRFSPLFWLLAHPPMSSSFQDRHLCPGTLGGTARERLPAAIGVFRRD